MSVSKEYYKDLSAQELSQDNFFIESITKPDEQSLNFWNEFLSEYPHCTTTVEEASVFVRLMKFELATPAEGAKERIWDNVIDESRSQAQVVNLATRRKWMWAAAAIAGAIVVSAFLWAIQGSNNIIAHAQYGEVKQLILPDRSVVTLNANSSLEYSDDWTGGVREVWLKGEAFFEVKHLAVGDKPIKESDRFIVHAGDAAVEVLGTTFNVSDRQKMVKVMLQTGSVRVQFKNNNVPAIVMEPGDLVQYDQQSKELVKEKVETQKYVSWKKKEILLDNTSVRDVVNVIEDTYGYKVIVSDSELLNRKISGTDRLSLENEQTLLKSLELMLDVKISKEDKMLRINKK
ncbi:MAG TPA: FecR domain-containing protein [Chitinophagaceae bacterium]